MKFLVLGCNEMAGTYGFAISPMKGGTTRAGPRAGKNPPNVPCVTGDVRDGAFLRGSL
jgi:hypothetical protein